MSKWQGGLNKGWMSHCILYSGLYTLGLLYTLNIDNVLCNYMYAHGTVCHYKYSIIMYSLVESVHVPDQGTGSELKMWLFVIST